MTPRVTWSAVCCVLLFTLATASCVPAGQPAVGTVQTIRLADVTPVVRLIGHLAPKAGVNVTPQVAGTVAQVHVRRGDVVKKGQLLAVVESPLLELQVRRRRLELERTRLRLQTAVATHTDNQQSLTLDLQLAELELSAAMDSLEDCRLTAPQDGVVMIQALRVGDRVGPGAGGQGPGILLAKPREFVVEVETDEYNAARVRPGMPVRVSIETAGFEQTTTVTAAPTFRRFRAGASGPGVFGFAVDVVASSSELLQAGLTARLDVVVGSRRAVPTLPIGAIHTAASKTYVMLANGGRPRRQEVRIGAVDDVRAEILDGPPVGTQVLLGAS